MIPSVKSCLSTLERELDQPKDIAALAAFRVLVGTLVSVSALRFINNGWVELFFVKPRYMFKFWGLEWVEVLPPQGMHLLFWALAALGLCVALGLFYRVAIVGTFVVFTYIELLDVTNYLNHYYLLSLLTFLMAFMPLHGAFSIDAMLRPGLRRETLPGWMTWLLRYQVAAVYLFAGLAKFGGDWLLHAQPLNIWLTARGEMPIVGPYLNLWWVALAMSWAGFLYDTTLPFWLLWRRSRPYAFAVLVAFHTAVGALFDIGIFPFIMVSVATVFFLPSWPRKLMGRAQAPASPPPPGPERALGRGMKTTLALVAIYCLIQAVVPMRSLFYPGNVLWHEQGMRWSWKVLVREKNGAVIYKVHLPRSGAKKHVPLSRYLTDNQAREMSGQPDMILQLGHHIGEEFRAKGHEDVEVRVHALVSLNGRKAQALIDPGVDLMTIKNGWGHASWIMPGPTSPPIRLRSAPKTK